MKEKFISALKEVPFWCLTGLKGYAAYDICHAWNELDKGGIYPQSEIILWFIYFVVSFYFTINWRRTHLKRATLIAFLECAVLFGNLYMSKYGFYCYLSSHH